jgi:hypothetical protein
MFQEHGLDMEKAEDYERGMQIFRASVSESMAHSYGIKSRDARLSVVTKIFFGADRMVIEVRNNLPMSKDEDRRVRLKMKQAMECETSPSSSWRISMKPKALASVFSCA